MIAASESTTAYLALDIGGTLTRIATIIKRHHEEPRIEGEPTIIDTPADPHLLAHYIAQHVQSATTPHLWRGVVGGVAGRVEGASGMLHFAPRLTPAWQGVSLHKLLAPAFSTPVESWWFNDTALVGLGEVHYGAGDPHGITAYLTISTGIGGCRFVDGEIDTRAGSFEPGHIVLDIDASVCPSCHPCPLDGTVDWEAMVSGRALELRRGTKPYRLPADDPVWNELAQWSAVGVRTVALMWTPHTIVLGGSMIVGTPAIPLDPIHDALATHPLTRDIALRPAALGTHGGIYGALRFVRTIEEGQ